MNPGDVVRCTKPLHLMVADIRVGEVGIVHYAEERRGYAAVQFVGRLLFHNIPLDCLEVVEPADYPKVMDYYL